MGKFLEHFDRELYPKLNQGVKRGDTFRKMFVHLEEVAESHAVTIIETGSARKLNQWSDGQSTFMWDLFLDINGGAAYSLDINPEAQAMAEANTRHMRYILGDSVISLHNLNDVFNADLIYLDSYDLDQKNPMDSALHHLMELTAIFSKLKPGCMIAVDDCISDTCGKHMLVKKFMDSIGVPPAFTGYQYGWIKPLTRSASEDTIKA